MRLTLSLLIPLTRAGLLAVGFERYGSAEQLESNAISHLYEIYVKINADAETDETVHDQAREFFKAMEDGTSSRSSRTRS